MKKEEIDSYNTFEAKQGYAWTSYFSPLSCMNKYELIYIDM